ncbi:MAG: efflux RND transporter periplasmic adaptor subunit [Gammaproteobacteria bacterium]|nr:efflux RND transporter periplasmic adaptor subunit [Gammaproteobacteria bacterium]
MHTGSRTALVFLGMLLCASALGQAMPPASVVVANAEVRQLAPAVDVPGTVISRYDSRLASELAAKLEWIAEVGAVVKKDETVARLQSITFELLEMEAQSRVKREQARVQFLLAEKSRLERLAENNLSAKRQLEQTNSELAVAESEEAIARAQLGHAQVAMYVTEIRAPFDGVVTERLRNIGERLNVADEVIRLVDPNSLEVVARAPLNTVNFIAERDQLELHNDYRADQASVRTIVPFGNPQSHMFEVRLNVDPELWTVGESVRVSMPTASAKEVLTVPRDALILRREGASVFKVNADMSVAQVNVITGLGDGEYIEVIGELDPGDRVVTRGAERLSTGMTVVISGSQSVATGAAASN